MGIYTHVDSMNISQAINIQLFISNFTGEKPFSFIYFSFYKTA